MRAMVTGGAGFIGSTLVRDLISRGAEVLNIDKLGYAGNLSNLGELTAATSYAFVKADILDRTAIERLTTAFRPDVVFHLAAETHVDRSIDGPEAFIQTNVVGTQRLLEAVGAYWGTLDVNRRHAFRFIHVSTDEVFGALPPTGRFSESSAYAPNSPYAASKAAGDHLVRAWYRTYGLPAVTVHPSNNYGPHQFPEKLIPLTIINAIEGKPLPVYGRGANIRDWLHVDDHVRALTLVAQRGRPGRHFVVGGDSERSNIDVVRAICRLLDEIEPDPAIGPRSKLIAFVPDRPGHDLRYASDSSRLRNELGWKPEIAFDDGLRRTVGWYLANRNWWQAIRARGYAGERLGLAVAS